MEECLTVFVLADQTDPKLTTKLKYYRNASFLGPRTKCLVHNSYIIIILILRAM